MISAAGPAIRRSLPYAQFAPMPDGSAPEAPIGVRRFRGIEVLAIVLSLSSICYAMRKTRELGMTNVQ